MELLFGTVQSVCEERVFPIRVSEIGVTEKRPDGKFEAEKRRHLGNHAIDILSLLDR